MVRNLPANAGDAGSTCESGRPPRRRKWQPTPVFLLGKSHVSYSLWGREELDILKRAQQPRILIFTPIFLQLLTNYFVNDLYKFNINYFPRSMPQNCVFTIPLSRKYKLRVDHIVMLVIIYILVYYTLILCGKGIYIYTQDLYWLNCSSNLWWECNFFPNFQTLTGLEGQSGKQETKAWLQSRRGLPQDWMGPSAPCPQEWNGQEGLGTPTSRGTKERPREVLAIYAFYGKGILNLIPAEEMKAL